MRIVALAGIGLLLGSCATMLNPHTKEVNIYTTKPSKIVFKKDTIYTADNRAYILPERGKKPVAFQVIKNDSVRTITLRAKNSLAFYANIYNYGIGLIADWKNPKRYTYSTRVFLDSDENKDSYYRYNQLKKKSAFYLHLSIPYGNLMYFKPEDYGQQFSGGFFGLSVGLDYYHKEKQYFSITASAATDYPVPFPAPVDDEGTSESMSTFYVSFSNNHLIKHFTFGYGLSVARNSWGIYPPYSSSDEALVIRNSAGGFIFSMYAKPGPRLNIGIIYRPTFYQFDTRQVEYEHLFSLDLAWKIRLTH